MIKTVSIIASILGFLVLFYLNFLRTPEMYDETQIVEESIPSEYWDSLYVDSTSDIGTDQPPPEITQEKYEEATKAPIEEESFLDALLKVLSTISPFIVPFIVHYLEKRQSSE